MIKVRVKGVAMTEADPSPKVILEEENGPGTLAVGVGAWEAGAMIMELEGVSTPRPLTHVLMAQLFREQGLHLDRVELYGVYGQGDDGFLARIEYHRGIHRWCRDVRPSDALALALSAGAPVYAHAALLRELGALWSDPASLPEGSYWAANHLG